MIQVYAHTADKTEEEIEKFLSELHNTIKLTKSRDIIYILGDFSAKIGVGTVENIVGQFGLGNRNKRGERP
ncbi:unnamed protein product [Diabrotica balteata]|uniref:Uncharacterized protein n=1 Tax=Diabrotica balteata TaxID=107213 RepID=A0A9N9TD03_DIABA|nr:unnamed protein product [Diabrotica balteata]